MANRYWVQNGGNYNDTAHWSSTSGGAGGQTVPGINDNAYFDANSFTLSNQIVTVDADVLTFVDMDWTGVLHTPTLDNSSIGYNFSIYGSLKFVSGMRLLLNEFTGFNFLATSTGKTVDFGGLSLAPTVDGETTQIQFEGVGGGWTLQSDIIGPAGLAVKNGSFSTNNKNLDLTFFDSSFSNTRSITLGSSVINCTNNPIEGGGGYFDISRTGLTFDAGTSTINLYDSTGLAGGYIALLGNTVYDVNIYNLQFYFIDNGTYHNLTIKPGTIVSFNNDPGTPTTQTITNNLNINGTNTRGITLNSFINGTQYTFSMSSGTVSASYVSIQDSIATGGATFNATNSIDNGNNLGWNFISKPTASKDENSVSTLLGTLNSDAATPVAIKANASTGALKISDVTTGSYTTITSARRDQNDIPCFMAVSSVDGVTPIAIYADSTGNLLTKSQ